MSKARAIGWYGVALALIGMFGLCQAANVQAQGLDDYVKKQKITAQKLENEVTQALEKARVKARTDLGAALNLLKNYEFALKHDSVLPDKTRKQLLSKVSAHIKAMESKVQAPVKKQRPLTRAEKYAQRLNKYRVSPAKVAAANSSTYATASKLYSRFLKAKELGDNYRYDREKGIIQALQGTERSATPPKSDFELPAYWAQLKKNRKQFVGPRLTKDEAKLLKIMNSVMTVSFERAHFGDVMKYLRKRTGAVIAVDPNAMKEVGTEYDTPISLEGDKVQVRTILKTVLAQANLAYFLKDGVVHVVTPDTARNTMTVRAYPIASLIPPPVPGMPYFMNLARQQAYANQLMQTIVTTIEPTSWAVNGGRGTIWYNPATKSIIVRQSAEMHLPASRALGIGSGR